MPDKPLIRLDMMVGEVKLKFEPMIELIEHDPVTGREIFRGNVREYARRRPELAPAFYAAYGEWP